MNKTSKHAFWLEQPIAPFLSKITIEHILIVLIILVTLLSRFYNLDLRVMSHDETNHVVPSYDLYMGRGYRHDPVTHGPFQFHIVALTYFLLGDNDFTSRVPAALFSTAAVAFVLIFYRRYLGKVGGILAGIFFMISPYMLFYGRYTRNEAFIMLFGVAMLYSVLRYIEDGKNKWLYLLTLSLVMHFISKETAYIYSAELLLFLGGLTLYDLIRYQWQSNGQRARFIVSTISSALIFLGAITLSIFFIRISSKVLQPTTLLTSPISNLGGAVQQLGNYLQTYGLYFLPIILPLLVGLFLLLWIRKHLVWNVLTDLRSFDLLILASTLVLPLLSPIFSKLAGIDPIDYTNQMGIYTTFFFILYMFAAAFIFGTAWKKEVWLKNAVLFFVIFIIFYTTVFTNGFGFFTGIVGGLGYWMAQHGLQRGNQPLYYYALIQIPIYEFLAACGTILALILGIRHKKLWYEAHEGEIKKERSLSANNSVLKPTPVLWLLLFWSIASLITFSIAGEKMPWLTVHIALPMLLCAGWAIGFLFNKLNNQRNPRKFWVALLAALFLAISLGNIFIILLGNNPPFQGKTQEQLQRTNYFLFALLITAALSYAVYYFTRKWGAHRIGQLLILAVFCLMILLTSRVAYFASFVNYDYPTEFLVYAHAAPGPKEILSQVEEISQRTTLGLGIKVAYDNHSRYPFWWYFRHFPNRIDYSENPTRSLEESPVILAGQANYSKLDPIVRDNYYSFEYMRLWWPMMDYYNLTPQRIWDTLRRGEMRQALFNIWLNRDYSLYAQSTNNPSLTLENWSPAEKFRLYIRKDIAAQIWNLGTSTSISQFQTSDPYAEKISEIQPSQIISGGGNTPGLLAAPRGIAIAADGSIFVADSHNSRIQHFSTDGKLINSWGTYANILDGAAPAGTFNEPWGIAIGPDDSVYVTDTWNYRIQKFTPKGEFIRMWGNYNIGSSPQGLYGPRGIIVNKDGKVFVTDTGNKRVVIYDSDGNYLNEFGSGGLDVGNFDEPVGITMDNEGKIFIVDTWNHRVQVFQPDQSGLVFSPVTSWNINGWFGQSINNKPFITISPNGNVFISDPEGSRILEFSSQGEFIHGWTGFNLSEDISSQPVDLKFDSLGRLWVSDAASNILMTFNDLQNQSVP